MFLDLRDSLEESSCMAMQKMYAAGRESHDQSGPARIHSKHVRCA